MAACSTTGRSGGNRRDTGPAGLSRSRSPAGLHRSPPMAAGLAAATAGAGLLRDAPRRALGYPELAAGASPTSWARVIEFNDPARRLRAIIDSARPPRQRSWWPQVVTTPRSTGRSRPTTCAATAPTVNARVARDAGLAYQAYVRLKLASVRAFGAELIVTPGVPAQSPLSSGWWPRSSTPWAVSKGIVYARADSAALEFETQTADHLPAWVKFLLAFDVKYRERRLQFLIEGQNRLYQLLGQEHFAGFQLDGDRPPQARILCPPRRPAAAGERRILWRRGARAGGQHLPS